MMISLKIPDHPYWKHTDYERFEQYEEKVTFPTCEYERPLRTSCAASWARRSRP